MLIDIVGIEDYLEDLRTKVNNRLGPENQILGEMIEKVQTGVYRCWGFQNHVQQFLGNKRTGQFPRFPKWKSPYGVADNLEQVFEGYKDQINDPDRTYALEICDVVKKDQPAIGGWRWHKWGPYIGTFNKQCEYLHDEEGIDGVMIFGFTEIDPKPQPCETCDKPTQKVSDYYCQECENEHKQRIERLTKKSD